MKSFVSGVHCTIYANDNESDTSSSDICATVQMIIKVIQAAMTFEAASNRPDSSASFIFS